MGQGSVVVPLQDDDGFSTFSTGIDGSSRAYKDGQHMRPMLVDAARPLRPI